MKGKSLNLHNLPKIALRLIASLKQLSLTRRNTIFVAFSKSLRKLSDRKHSSFYFYNNTICLQWLHLFTQDHASYYGNRHPSYYNPYYPTPHHQISNNFQINQSADLKPINQKVYSLLPLSEGLNLKFILAIFDDRWFIVFINV